MTSPTSESIGIQGLHGSYHEQALVNINGHNENVAYIDTFPELYSKLRSGTLGSAIVAIYNSNPNVGIIAGSFGEILTGDFAVLAETYVGVHHQLLGVPGASIEGLREVHSMAPALGQCGKFLHSGQLSSSVKRVEQEDTAGSAQLIAALQDPTKEAIASRKAAEIYGLQILKENIQDDPDNTTRFLHIEKLNGQVTHPQANKTTALLQTGQAPGSLVDALTPFKDEGVNIDVLLSGFIPESTFGMKFYMDFDASIEEARMHRILERLDKLGNTVTILGSYVAADIPISNRGMTSE